MSSSIVEVSEGTLKGTQWTDYDGNIFHTFLGVPYAKPPIGELRFKAPVAAEPWTGVRDATKEGNRCYSRHERTGTLGGSEDCLNLNIYARTLPQESSQLKPVMVYIHGGGFTGGCNSPAMYGPQFLLTEDVVLTTINYRLGIFGFLCLKDPALEVPGNAGLKDQVMALKWIRANIEKFNGDPNNITIFGNSAGSISVNLLMVSPLAQGLFHRVIMQSGTVYNSWGEGDFVAFQIAEHVGEKVETEQEALEVLKKASTEKLGEVREKMDAKFTAATHRYFGGVIEYPNPTAFLTKCPLEIIRSGNYNKVPVMMGYTSREAILKLGMGAVTETKPDDEIPWQMGLEADSEAREVICSKIRKYYLEGINKDDTFLLPTDSLFVAGIMAGLKNLLENLEKPIFLYRMTLEARLNVLKSLLKADKLPGVCHADELGYLFKSDSTIDVEKDSIEDISIRRFVKLWANFARCGNPTPKMEQLKIVWKPVEKQKLYFLDIGKDLTLSVDPEKERMELWREIFKHSSVTEHFL